MASLIGAGLSNRAIAARLRISLDTAKRHASRIKQKLQLHTTAGLACQPWLPALPDLVFLPPSVSRAERRVLLCLCAGGTSKHIARELGLSARTVDQHRAQLLRKCGRRSTRELLAWVALAYVKGGIVPARTTP